MAGRLNHVQVEVAGTPVAIPWESREALLAELVRAQVAGAIVEAFRTVGASRRVELTREQKVLLVALLDGWARRETVRWMPQGIWTLRVALADEIQQAK